MCAPSTASGRASAMRRKSATVGMGRSVRPAARRVLDEPDRPPAAPTLAVGREAGWRSPSRTRSTRSAADELAAAVRGPARVAGRRRRPLRRRRARGAGEGRARRLAQRRGRGRRGRRAPCCSTRPRGAALEARVDVDARRVAGRRRDPGHAARDPWHGVRRRRRGRAPRPGVPGGARAPRADARRGAHRAVVVRRPRGRRPARGARHLLAPRRRAEPVRPPDRRPGGGRRPQPHGGRAGRRPRRRARSPRSPATTAQPEGGFRERGATCASRSPTAPSFARRRATR